MLKTAAARPISPSGRIRMSRFHRNVAQYRVWAPTESSVRVEYSMEVLREAARHERGVLYGIRDGASVRVVAARRDQAGQDPRLSKLELLGTFACRARGEVFLTELNLEHLERTGGSLALVVAGTNAGFFVYEPDGAIQTIQSYQEFAPFDRTPVSVRMPKPRPDRRNLWISLACLTVLAIPVIAPAFPRGRPLALSVREESSELRISWASHAFPSARLEISDGADQTWIPVPSDLSSATYVPRTAEVNIRLIAGTRSESAHFVGMDPMPVMEPASAPAPEIDQIQKLKSEAEALRANLAHARQHTASLQSSINAIVTGGRD
jgi:hypothetical protein